MKDVLKRERAGALQRLKPYPAYKDSGVEWLGEIPAHWKAAKMWQVGRAMSGGTPAREERTYWDGDIPWVSPKDMKRRLIDSSQDTVTERAIEETGIKLIAPPVVLIVVRGMILAHSFPVAITTVPVTINQDMKALTFRVGILPLFMVWLFEGVGRPLLATIVEEAAHGTRAIRMDQWRSVTVPVPAEVEQRGIIAFLDRKTARIDALVAKKERLIELLQEKRTALITGAVTTGLDPNVPVKDSGVEWLGKTPAHWEVKRLWHLTPSDRRIMYGIVLPGPNVDDGVLIVKGGDVSPERLRIDRLNRTTREIESGYVRSRLRGGDLVYAIRGSIGEVAMVPLELQGANLTQDAARISYTSATHGPWLLQALKSMRVFAQLEAGAVGATIRGINIRDLKRASIAVPPVEEQRAIAAFLHQETARIDALIAKVHEAIDRLKELRTALTSAAVTGKIDLRKEVA